MVFPGSEDRVLPAYTGPTRTLIILVPVQDLFSLRCSLRAKVETLGFGIVCTHPVG